MKTFTQFISKRALLGCAVILSLLSSNLHAASYSEGGNSSGGGGPDQVNAGALKLLIEDGGLKRAMDNYIRTLAVKSIESPGVRAVFERITANGKLAADIMTPNNYFASTPNEPCVDAFNNKVPASTQIGKLGGRICFDLQKLVAAYKGFAEEDVMIQLAGLAFHEHVHHFQTPSRDIKVIEKNEYEANLVAGYVLVTAKFVQIPLLEWSPTNMGVEFSEIRKLFDTIRAKERKFMTPKDSDFAAYPSYRNQPDRGVFRILPREIYDGKLSMRGGGSYYSFTSKSNDYDSIAELELQGEYLSSGFAGCDFGMITRLGTTPLEKVALNHPALAFLLDFKVAVGEPAIRIQQRNAHEIHENGFTYSSRIRDFNPGETFAVRAVSFGYADMLAAFQIVRREKDGSLIIAWKKLQTFPVSECR